MTVNEKILKRIRKLIALANDAGATEGERDNALRMAHATLAKYNLDMEEVASSQHAEDRVQLADRFFGQRWARTTCHYVAELFFCSYFYRRINNNTDDINHYFVGKHSNAVTASEIAQFVVRAINKEAQRYRKATGSSYKSYRAFCQGAMLAVSARCQLLQSKAETMGVDDTQPALAAPGTSTALVLASLYQREAQANADYLKSTGTEVREGKAGAWQFADDTMAHHAGARFGQRVSLQPQLEEK